MQIIYTNLRAPICYVYYIYHIYLFLYKCYNELHKCMNKYVAQTKDKINIKIIGTMQFI